LSDFHLVKLLQIFNLKKERIRVMSQNPNNLAAYIGSLAALLRGDFK
jgi:hypothetical protein